MKDVGVLPCRRRRRDHAPLWRAQRRRPRGVTRRLARGFRRLYAHIHRFGENPDDFIMTIDGLWSQTFGNDGPAGLANKLYFTAGINHEVDGPSGAITPVDGLDGDEENSARFGDEVPTKKQQTTRWGWPETADATTLCRLTLFACASSAFFVSFGIFAERECYNRFTFERSNGGSGKKLLARNGKRATGRSGAGSA